MPKKQHLEIISLGGGVQSSAMVLMSLAGEIEPKADCAIFSDTGWEGKQTYEYVGWLTEYCRERNFPVYHCSAGNIHDDHLNNSKNHNDHIPFFVDSEPDTRQLTIGFNGNGDDEIPVTQGRLKRQCTNHYKIRPLRRKIRSEFGFPTVNFWIGISTDEITRMKPSDVKYITHVFPLIKKRWSRSDCLEWLGSQDLPIPPKSACVGCVYHSDPAWSNMKISQPNDFEQACRFDEQMRNKHLHKAERKSLKLYLHRSLKPLRNINFKQENNSRLLEQEECSGGCFL